jgi:hypothetical protein
MFSNNTTTFLTIGRKDKYSEEKTMEHTPKRTPWFLWPFVALADLVTWIVSLTGRMAAILIGLVLAIVGVILTVLVITAPIGLPLLVLGIMLMVRGLW